MEPHLRPDVGIHLFVAIETKLDLGPLAEVFVAVAAFLLQIGVRLSQIPWQNQPLHQRLRIPCSGQSEPRKDDKPENMPHPRHLKSVQMDRNHVQGCSAHQHNEKRQVQQVPE